MRPELEPGNSPRGFENSPVLRLPSGKIRRLSCAGLFLEGCITIRLACGHFFRTWRVSKIDGFAHQKRNVLGWKGTADAFTKLVALPKLILYINENQVV